jgi:hypothetical protein
MHTNRNAGRQADRQIYDVCVPAHHGRCLVRRHTLPAMIRPPLPKSPPISLDASGKKQTSHKLQLCSVVWVFGMARNSVLLHWTSPGENGCRNVVICWTVVFATFNLGPWPWGGNMQQTNNLLKCMILKCYELASPITSISDFQAHVDNSYAEYSPMRTRSSRGLQ